MILGLDLEKLRQNLETLDFDELMRIAKEMDWKELASSRESDWEELKQSLGEGDLKEVILILKEMDREELIEGSKLSSPDKLKNRLKGHDLKRAMMALGLILVARKAVERVGGMVEGREEEPETTYSEETSVEVETEEEKVVEEEMVKDDFVGSSSSDKFHRPECGLAKRISPENRVWFRGVEDAESQGYKPCSLCSPS